MIKKQRNVINLVWHLHLIPNKPKINRKTIQLKEAIKDLTGGLEN